MFVIVEFDNCDGSGLALVAQNWLTPRKKEVFWPPVQEQRHFDKLLKENADVKSDWKIYQISRQFYETEDYDTARKKLKLAETTSDLASEIEQNGENSVRPKRIRKSRVFSSSDSGDESNLIRPPRLNVIKGKRNVVDSSPGSSIVTPSSKQQAAQLQRTPLCTPHQIIPKNLGQSSNPDLNEYGDVLATSAFQKKLFTKLVHLEEQNNVILDILNNKFSDQNVRQNNKFPVNFPISSQEELHDLENILQVESNFEKLVNKCSSFGGKDVATLTYRILKYLLDDDIACLYSIDPLVE